MDNPNSLVKAFALNHSISILYDNRYKIAITSIDYNIWDSFIHERFARAILNDYGIEVCEEINLILLMWISKIKEYYDGSGALIEACNAEKQNQIKINRKNSISGASNISTSEIKLPSLEYLQHKNLKFIGNVLQNIVNHNRKFPFLYSFTCILLSKFSHLYASIKNIEIGNFAIGILIGMLNNSSMHVIRTFYESDFTIWTANSDRFNLIWAAMEYKSLLFYDEITLYKAINFFINIISNLNIDEWEMKILERVNKIFVFLVFHPNTWIRKSVGEYFTTLQRQINSIALWYHYGRPLLISCIKDKAYLDSIEISQITSHPLPRILFDYCVSSAKKEAFICNKEDTFAFTLIKEIIIDKISEKKSMEIEDYDKQYDEHAKKEIANLAKHKYEVKEYPSNSEMYNIETVIDVDNFIDKKYYPYKPINQDNMQDYNGGLNSAVDPKKFWKPNHKTMWPDMYKEQWISKSLCAMKMSNMELGKPNPHTPHSKKIVKKSILSGRLLLTIPSLNKGETRTAVAANNDHNYFITGTSNGLLEIWNYDELAR